MPRSPTACSPGGASRTRGPRSRSFGCARRSRRPRGTACGTPSPVWRSRYDGPYTGLDDDPEFAQYAGLLHGAHGGDGAGIWQGGGGLAASMHDAWGAFAATGDPG